MKTILYIILGGVALIFVAGVLIAALGGDDDDPEIAAITRCESVPQSTTDLITSNAEHWQAVKSNDFETVWFVGVAINGEIAVWATNDLDEPGLTYSVNDLAFEASGLAHSDSTDAAMNMNDDGAAEVVACVEEQLS